MSSSIPFYPSPNNEEWEVGPDYEVLQIIGNGAFGSVCIGRHVASGLPVAIKKVEYVFVDVSDCRRILREIQMLKSLNHPNIVRIIDILLPKNLQDFNELYIVLEYIPSDLFQVITSRQIMCPTTIKTIMYNILQAVKYLHSIYVVHRDLKPANILIDENCQIKLCDFDLSRKIIDISNSSSPEIGRASCRERV